MRSTLLILATILPIASYWIIGIRKASKARNLADYFVFNQEVSARDYANTSIGYALQMAALFLFADWGIRYGLGSLWTPVFWALGFWLLYMLLPRMLAYHGRGASTTLHQYLADQAGAGRGLRRLAASATILGLWGTMMAEADYATQVYVPVLPAEVWRWALLAFFVLAGTIYIVVNGYKAEVNTERFQVPTAYVAMLAVLLLCLPQVWIHSGPKPFLVATLLLALVFVGLLVGKVFLEGLRIFQDRQSLIPLFGLFSLAVVLSTTTLFFLPGSSPTVLDHSFREQLSAQGFLGLLSLFLANALWMPVDLSTWQRVASVKGTDVELLHGLRRGTLRVMLESPISWLLGVVLGLIIHGGGFLPITEDPSGGIAAFAAALWNGTLALYPDWFRLLLYPLFTVSCIAIMLSTVDSIVSAIAFTAYKDFLADSNNSNGLPAARAWTIRIVLGGLVAFPLLHLLFGSNLPAFLYAAYAAQLSLIVVVLLALYRRKLLQARAAYCSLGLGLLASAVGFLLALRIPDPRLQVLPPIVAILGAAIGYILGFAPSRSPR